VVINASNVPETLSVTDIIRHNTDRLVGLLRSELELERIQQIDRLHARTLEQIFIENRIYRMIENKKNPELVMESVSAGLADYTAEIARDITEDDINTLLKIPIRRISLYDINRAKKEMREIKQRLTAIDKLLGDMTKVAINFLKGLIRQYGDRYVRRTELESFRRTAKHDVAKRDLQLRFEKRTGYVGLKIGGTVLCEISPYDRILLIRADGTYTIMEAPDKVYAGRDMLHCGILNPDQIFNIVYTDPYQHTFIKRCTIGRYILNRPYQLIPDHCHLEALTTALDALIHLSYIPKPRLRKLEESFATTDYPIRNEKAGGIRLATKELADCRVDDVASTC
jgi:topoisomerase-4 subunit A